MGCVCLGVLLLLLCPLGGAEGGRADGAAVTQTCPKRRVSVASLSGQSCSKACTRDGDCRKRQCRCDGACGLSCVQEGRPCPWPVAVDNATVTLLGSGRPVFGLWMEVACRPGFEAQSGPGVSRHRCQGDRRWSGTLPECRPVQGHRGHCGDPPEVLEGSYQGLDFSTGKSIQYRCNPGFVLEGPEVNYCRDDGSWVHQAPNCTAVSCRPPPEVPQAQLVAVERGWYPPGHRVYYLCRRGYHMAGSHRVTCDRGQWTQLPSCRAPCTLPSRRDQLLYRGQKMWATDIPGGKVSDGESLHLFCADPDRGCSYPALATCSDGLLRVPACYREPTWVRSTLFPWRLVSEGPRCDGQAQKKTEEGGIGAQEQRQRRRGQGEEEEDGPRGQ